MAFAVVAGDAFQVQAEEILTRTDGHLVVGIGEVDHQIVEVVNVIAEEVIGGRVHPVVARTRGQQLAHQLVVRNVQQQRIIDVVAQQISATRAQLAGGIAKQVAEKVRPLVEKRRFRLVQPAFDGRGEQLIDHLFALQRVFVGEKLANHFRFGQPAGEIQMNAAEELRVGAQAGMRNRVALHPSEDELINEVSNGNRLEAGLGSFRRNVRGEFVQALHRPRSVFGVFRRLFGCYKNGQREPAERAEECPFTHRRL